MKRDLTPLEYGNERSIAFFADFEEAEAFCKEIFDECGEEVTPTEYQRRDGARLWESLGAAFAPYTAREIAELAYDDAIIYDNTTDFAGEFFFMALNAKASGASMEELKALTNLFFEMEKEAQTIGDEDVIVFLRDSLEFEVFCEDTRKVHDVYTYQIGVPIPKEMR